jgi:CheY-like chemotaxis protein
MEGRMEHGASIAPLRESERGKILLVDDQPAKLLSYEAVLDGIGAPLIKASCACEAFEQLLKNDVALILIDVCMPDIDGFELASLIREHPRFQRIGIIFVSAVMTADLHRLRGYELGAVDYIAVPVVPELLRAKVKVFVDLFHETRQLERLNAELERRVLERSAELRRCNQELEQRIEERTREREAALAQLIEARQTDTVARLAEVAHDFNNLLMTVLASLTLLEKHIPEDREDRRLLRNATRGARRGAVLTRELLAFSRRRELKPQSADIGGLVSGMQMLLRCALGPGIELRCSFPPALPLAWVDPNRLELALLDAALTAREAMPDGGRLVICACEDSEAAGSPPAREDQARIKIVAAGRYTKDGVATEVTTVVIGVARAGIQPLGRKAGVLGVSPDLGGPLARHLDDPPQDDAPLRAIDTGRYRHGSEF